MATFKNARAYINTDLEMWSYAEITGLAKYFDEHAVVLNHLSHEGRNLVSVEADCGAECFVVGEEGEEREQSVAAAEGTIKVLLDLIEHLPSDLRKEWDQCDERLFDMGYDSHETENNVHRTDLSPETLRRLQAVDGTLRITVYPVMEEPVEPSSGSGETPT